VEVYADGNFLFSFDFYESKGPLALPANAYFIEVKLQGKTVLSDTAQLESDKNYTAIAHLVTGGDIKLSFFENDIGKLDVTSTRITLRHTADAPSVDIGLNYSYSLFYPLSFAYLKARGLSNDNAPSQFGAVDLPYGFYSGIFYAAGTDVDVYDTGGALLLPNTAYIVYAIGSFGGGTFTLFIQAINL
jgi:hypothetical protein